MRKRPPTRPLSRQSHTSRRWKTVTPILPERAAELRAAAEYGYPEAWIPSQDDPELVGEFVRLEHGQTAHGPAWIAILRAADGQERSLWLLHTVLRNEFTRQRPQQGELVVVRYLGPKQGAQGQAYESYRVVVDRIGRETD